VATSDKEQQSVLVPQHKRIAAGAKLDGQSMQGKGDTGNGKPAQGGLAQAKKK
jgi:hypothetical protein